MPGLCWLCKPGIIIMTVVVVEQRDLDWLIWNDYTLGCFYICDRWPGCQFQFTAIEICFSFGDRKFNSEVMTQYVALCLEFNCWNALFVIYKMIRFIYIQRIKVTKLDSCSTWWRFFCSDLDTQSLILNNL